MLNLYLITCCLRSRAWLVRSSEKRTREDLLVHSQTGLAPRVVTTCRTHLGDVAAYYHRRRTADGE